MSTVAAIAGRRIDAPGTKPARFPISAVASVKSAVKRLLEARGTRVAVAAAACGADILALKLQDSNRCAALPPHSRHFSNSSTLMTLMAQRAPLRSPCSKVRYAPSKPSPLGTDTTRPSNPVPLV